jgi:hypothetical protein
MDHAALASRLLAAAAERAGAAAAGWLAAARSKRELDLGSAFAAASRALGRAPLALTEAEAGALAHAGLTWSTGTWSVDDAARAGLLLSRAVHAPAPRLAMLVEDLHRLGGLRERAALMRALPLLPLPSRFLALARSAARAEAAPLFLAIARDNPYPALHFPEEALRQLSLRARELGVPASGLPGVERRRALGLDALLSPGALP